MTSSAWDIPSGRGTSTTTTATSSSITSNKALLSSVSPKWQEAAAPNTSPRRKLSVLDVATSPMAVNFHTWRVNALTTNAYRQSQFLENAQKAIDEQEDKEAFARKALRILKDLGLPAPDSRFSAGYGSLRALLLAPAAALSDAEWLIAMKTFLAPLPAPLVDEFKEAFGIREDEPASLDPDTATAVSAEDLEGKPLVRRSSSKVQFDQPMTPVTEDAYNDNTYFPPTPAPIETHLLPFDFGETTASPMTTVPESARDIPVADDEANPVDTNEVCLNGHYIAYDLHVAMMDRPAEMRDLVARNPEIFENIQHTCPNDDLWIELEDIFYASREEMDDLTWMRSIGARMESNPSMLAMLKELVGYDMHEEVFGDDQSESDQSLEDNADDDEEEPERLEWLDKIVKMREMPEIMARLENDYPQFFANVKKALSATDETEYEHFSAAFFSPPEQLSDDEWEREIQRYLSRAKQLLGQLREIALYELDIDEEKPEPEDNIFEPSVVPESSSRTASGPSTSRIEVKARADPSTIRGLETDHPLFFNLLRKHLNSREEYHRFLRVLYAPRESIADEKWEPLITHRFLSSSRRLRQMFREVVDATVIATSEIMDSDDEEYLGRFEAPLRGHSEYSQRILRLQVASPDLFNRIKRKLGDQYGRFLALLVTGRDELTDDAWAERVEAFLESDVTLSAEFASVAGIQQMRKPASSSGASGHATTTAPATTSISHPTHISLPPQVPTINAPPRAPDSPTPSTSSVAFAVREQLPASVPQLEFYLGLKTAVDDDKVYGKLLHAVIERDEAQKIVARDDHPSAAGSVAPTAAAAAAATAEVDGNSADVKALMDVLDEVVGPASDIGKRVESWVAARP
ncbi:hypothetical protein HKX48_008336 [Thoreauomyces humboldtii]|nr:hypothetical protein HKX48_008336 [Thoreauomyces humboldtii]